jgi:hypothetical protein
VDFDFRKAGVPKLSPEPPGSVEKLLVPRQIADLPLMNECIYQCIAIEIQHGSCRREAETTPPEHASHLSDTALGTGNVPQDLNAEDDIEASFRKGEIINISFEDLCPWVVHAGMP